MKKSVKKKENIVQIKFKESVNYLKSSRKHIYLMIYVFVFFALIGFFVPMPEEITSQLLAYFEQLIEQTKDFGTWEMIGFLFQNNVLASFLGVVGGLSVGLFPLVNAIMNGFVLGFASSLSVTQNGIFSLWRLFPHGIFELPALFISLGIGFNLGSKFLERYFKINGLLNQFFVILGAGIIFLLFISALTLLIFDGTIILLFLILGLLTYYFIKDEFLRQEFGKSLRTFLYIVVPLLILAAIIEGTLIVLG